MKNLYLTTILLLLAVISTKSQTDLPSHINQKGKIYFYWGWNWDWYSKSNITFTGDDYDFTLNHVIAKDRQSDFTPNKYFNPTKATIPQYNFRIGYFIKENWNVSLGIDHMKYVVLKGQTVDIEGDIHVPNSKYDGEYTLGHVKIKDDFLKFEHTDGLNYVNVELRRIDKIAGHNKFKLNFTEGFGLGILEPRTNTTLLKKKRYDQFHLAGYGLGAVIGINLTCFDHFFIQTELKSGFINMPDIRTTESKHDKAKQSFFFTQYNFVLGYIFRYKK